MPFPPTEGMSPIPDVPEVPALDNTYGAYLLGTSVSLVLYGLCLQQLYVYIRTHDSDTPFIRGLVVVVMSLETLHIILLMHSCYYYLIESYFDPIRITETVWSLEITPVFSSFITLVSQIFFARRVYLIGFRYKLLACGAVIALLAHVGFGIAITANTGHAHSLHGFQQEGDWLFPAVTGSAVIGDFLLSAGIIVAVHQTRKSRMRPQSENWVDIAMLYVVNSGLLTGAFNVLPWIAAIPYPQTFIWAGLSFVGTRFYAITLLSVLNSRKLSISRGMEIFEANVVTRNIIARANHIATAERWNAPQVIEEAPEKINISVSAEVHQQAEDDTSQFEHKGYDTKSI